MTNLKLIIISLLSISCYCQKIKKFNLDFETYDSLYLFPKGWMEWGDYQLSADTIFAYSGKFASKITSTNNGDSFGSIAYKIPANYKGDTIRLDGYMKIKNIEGGFGGLLLRINGDGKMLAFDNMERQNVHGTKDWQKYSISLPYPKNAETIFVAGIMTGNGEAWFDDFVITIDGKDIQTLKEKNKPTYKAKLDNEFDLNSKINIPKLNKELISNLELLGKVWGFLKYYHPEVGKGNYNWDYELFRVLPKYLSVGNKYERDQALIKWIKKYGEIKKCIKCKETSPNSFLKPDITWVNDFELNIELKGLLKHVYQNRYQGKHFYLSGNNSGNPKFINEKKYYSISFNDNGYSLLALYRYWNMIHYFYPNKYLTDKNWNHVLKEYIPKFISTKNKLEYELNCLRLISEINDTHATTTVGFNNLQNIRGEFFPPFKSQFVEDKLVVTDYYNPELKQVSKINVGDIITHINGKSIKYILDSITPYYPASNKVAKLRDISKDLLRSNKKEIRIDYISDNIKKQTLLPLYEKNNVNMKWYKWTGEKCYKLLNDNIGYITLEFIKKEDIPIIKEIFKDTKGIIVDIRNYPSAFVPFLLGSYFVSNSTPFVKFLKFNIDNPGEFSFTKALEIKNDNESYKGNLVVLVNEDSQSQSEYTAMAFRAGNNTTIVGSTTAGADGNVSSIYLPGGLLTRISGIGIYYPDGTETQRVGIIPDIEIKPTIKGIKEGRDELLEKAIEIITKKD
ncbi:S41 family peptidase [Snuella sedimenti]|uniref:Peptidase S41 n=1 Tax=Snuella sedimenti TaxID=2798802 RepID=A0A8J7LUN3_9FLAO|nr:S41 family peptidase [Snuella sedimenti]MBJ6369846.1 peptidase S41 [Snuella sedimenti]